MEIIGNVAAILKRKGSAVYSVQPTDTVFEAITLMAGKNVGALLVMDDGRLVGVISERDYTRKVALLGKDSRTTLVREIITNRLFTVPPEATVSECLRLMVDNRVRHLPIVEGGAVIGVVSIGDLVNWVITSQTAAIEQLESYISGGYPA
jgi:CBS domain-containing protein